MAPDEHHGKHGSLRLALLVIALASLVALFFAWRELWPPETRAGTAMEAQTSPTPNGNSSSTNQGRASNPQPASANHGGGGTPYNGMVPNTNPRLENIDRRRPGNGEPTAQQRAALDELARRVPGVAVQFDPITGSPNNIMATGRFLSRAPPATSDPAAQVRAFIKDNAALFGHNGDSLDNARVTRDDVTAHNGMRTVVWQQQVDGIPLYNTILKANLTKDGALVAVGSQFMADAVAATQMGAGPRAALLATPPVDVTKALSLAAADLGDQIAPGQIAAASQPEGAERKQSFTAPLLSDIVAQLSWLPMSADSARLTWDLTLMSLSRREMFRVLVDARTGVILMRTSLTNDLSNASYRVYANPGTFKPHDNPAPMLPGTPTPSGAQGTEVSRNLVTLQAADITASPNGWISDGGTETLGNNVDAHTDTNADNVADLPRPTSAARVFDFVMDTTQAPGTYKDAAVTQLFYLNNWMHDQLYALGFTESAGNFQTNNFSRGGLGNDPVQSDAQDGSGTNNANMSTPADGSAPRMQMYVFTGPTPDRDGDFDAVVVLHEYTHGLSNRLVGGGVGMSALASRGMGEGWSDFYGLALLADPNSDPNAVYPGGSYATFQFSGMTTNYYYGIRRYPYSTDMTKNPLTLRDIDPTQASPHAGIPLSPLFGSSNSSPSEVHNVGEVWCMVLWECRAKLITKYGAIGNQKILQLTTDAMKLCPANPNLLQSRDAIIQADLVGNGGANYVELWAAFAKRGMGNSATAPASSTTTGVVEAFDVPDPLVVLPGTPVTASGPVGGPFTPTVQIYTLTNSGATAPITWTAVVGSPWLSVSPSAGTLAAGASTTVTMSINSSANALAAGAHSDSVNFTNTTSGLAFTRTVSLAVGQVDNYTELFTSTNDTDNQSWLFTPDASDSCYAVLRTAGVSAFPTDPTGGTNLALSDNSNLQVTPTGGAIVKLYGTTYSSFFVGSNGNITFGTSDTLSAESLANHFARPRISALFDDLNPASAGSVSWRQLADRVAVTYQNVPQYGTTDSNNFQVEMFFDGRIRITCLGIAATDGLIGLSRGLGTPTGFVGSDFSAYPTTASPPMLVVTVPATVTEGHGVLVGQGSVTLPAMQASDVVVTLTSSNTGEVTVPATVTVLAGHLSAMFDVAVVDDAGIDGTQTAIITASSAGYSSGANAIAVQDNDGTATLTLTAPASVTEGVGTVQGTITISVTPTVPVTVGLSSSDSTAVQVPAGVVIPAGQTSATFAISVVNDAKIDGTQNATITAHVVNWTDGVAAISVLDNENTNLAISVPTSVTEGGTGTGTVTISGMLQSSLVVSLSSNNISRLTVPATVTISSGSTSATFTLTAPNNTLTDGTASAIITASATGFTSASATTSVLDNDVHHFNVSTIASPQTRGIPFSASITAKDVNDMTIASYTTAASISASGTGGIDSITPASTAAFTAGVWTGNVTVNTFDTNVVLTASDGAGHTGASNAFNVGIGALHHFAWDTQATRVRGAAASATVTAQDLGNNTVTSFGGKANLSGYINIPGGSNIVITEVNPNTPDEIEFMNVGLASVDISGWTIYIYDFDTGGTAPKTFVIPAGTTCTAGQIFRLQESGTSPGIFPLFYYGANINWTSDSASPVAVLLRNSSGNMVDFVCAAGLAASSVTSPATIPASQWTGTQTAAPSNFDFAYARQGNNDGNSAADWTTSIPGLGTVNPGLSPPFTVATAVQISPTVSNNFTGGVWTGNMTVMQSASQMRFRADDGASHVGDSNAFDVNSTVSANAQSVDVSFNTPKVITLTGQDSAKPGATLNYGIATPPAHGTLSGAAPNVIYTPVAGYSGMDSFTFTAANGTDTGTPAIVSLRVLLASREISVEYPVGHNLEAGSSTVAFGDSPLGGPVVKTLTIRNAGSLPLNIIATTVDGANPSDFHPSAPGGLSVPAGGSATFDVRFAPSSTGGKCAALHLASDDADENPFDITLTGIGSAPAGPLRLARDINQTGVGTSITNVMGMGGVVYFAATTAETGTELWKSDGKGDGTMLVKDINPGSVSSSPANLRLIGTTLYFTATTAANGVELWKSDGTTAGTVLVKDIRSGSSSSSPANLSVLGSTLFFTATDGTTGIELWKSDGTAAGTVLVKDIYTGASSASPASLTSVNGILYFSTTDGTNGIELWKSDGTAAGTVLVKDIYAGASSASPANLTSVNGILYFSATDGTNGIELWRSDGTAMGTVLVSDIYAGATSSSPAGLVSAGGKLFFRANTAAGGVELWKSDGTAAGTVQVKDINLGSSSSTPSSLVAVGPAVYFAATDGVNGIELWKSDGTAAGTVMVMNINPGASSSSPANLTLVGDMIYFSATDGINGIELWKTDGTAAGTVMVEDINPGSGSSSPAAMTSVDGLLIFLASDGVNGTEMWASNGSGAGTRMVRDITPASGDAAPAKFSTLNGVLAFSANDGLNGTELWRSDGMPGGTSLLKDISAGTGSSSPGTGVHIGSTLYFSATDSTAGTELWKTDGTPAGTVRAKDIYAGAGSSSPANLTNFNGTLCFSATNSTTGIELWRSDGTDAGTALVKDIRSGSSGSSPANLTVVGSTLFFSTTDGTTGIELWKSDGTAAGTALVKDIYTGASSSSPANLANVNGTLCFSATDATTGIELWKSDGTDAGTVLVKDIRSGSSGSSPANLTVAGGTLFFTATDGTTGVELWKSDGTAAGTVLVKDIYTGASSSSPANLTNVNGILYFSASNGSNGIELWKSDGTAAGTVLVKDIYTGSSSSSPGAFANVNGTLYFSATDGSRGIELWKSDGSAAGTVLAADIQPGALSSSPANLTVIGNQLFFSATGPDLGTELWVLDIDLPEISVEQPVGTVLSDGSANIGFGSISLGSSSSAFAFTVKNLGTADLTGLAVTKNGTNAADYIVGSLGATTLTAGNSTTFTVTFAPGASGARTAAIHIASNDTDETPFDINLTGTGAAAPLSITTATLSTGAIGVPYSQALTATGGSPPYAWSLVSGVLPPMLNLSSNGVISGTPTSAMTASLTIQVTGSDLLSSTANFSLTITSPYAAWQSSRFTPDDIASGLAAMTADFDGDGTVNLLEYAFGKIPKAADLAGITSNVAGNKLQISFPCDLACTDITYTVQASPSLAESSWTDIAKSIGGAAVLPVGPLSTVSDSATGLRTVTVTDSTEVPSGGMRFLRVMVTSP